MQNWFGELNLELIAEHGVWFKERNKNWKMIKPLSSDWKSQVYPILVMFEDRLPGSFIEEKDFSLAFHFRKADPELASIRTRELLDHLFNFTANIDVNVIKGNKVIEIRCSGINKGTTGLRWIAKRNYNFILAIGDDVTDEDLFKVLPEQAYSVKVGSSKTCSRCFLPDHKSVITFLNQLIY